MRCPACGASNSDRAEWCTQCFQDLRTPEPPASEGPTPDPSASEARPLDPSAAEVRTPGPAADAQAAVPDVTQRDVRTVDGEIEWRCARCEAWNPLMFASCATCGAERQGFGDPTRPPAPDPASRTQLVVASVLLPGLGHILARRTGTGTGRLILAVTWVLGAVLLSTSGAGTLPVASLLFGVAVVWAGTLHDVLGLFDGGRELLTSRVLLWLTGGVIVTLLATLFLTSGAVGAG